MRFSSSAVALAVLGFASAAPTGAYSPTPTNCTTSSPTPAPCKTLCPSPIPEPPCPTPKCEPACPTPQCETRGNTPTCQTTTTPQIIRPDVTSQYKVWTGAIDYNTTHGKISKNGRDTDITTLLTFKFPAASKGKTCSFHFDLSPDPAATVSGTGQFDVYTSLAPATQSTTSWPPGNLRDHHIGRMSVQPHAAATWVAGFPTSGQSFPCPGAEETYGGELVGTGDVDFVQWLAGTSGPYIQWQQ